MKKILLLIISFFLTAQTIKAQTVVLDANGVTVKWTGTTVPSPYFVQASPRGTLEWFAIVNNTTKSNITDYALNIQSGITYFTRPTTTTSIPFNNIVTTLVTTTKRMFQDATAFNQPIGSWDLSNVTDMSEMFYQANSFNQPISSWNFSNVTNMSWMFGGADAFNQNIGSWNVSNVTNMSYMFNSASSFNKNISSWNVSNVTNMSYMFQNTLFNQNIGSWNVSNVTNMAGMFTGASAFNQNISSWDVSNVTNMSFMFNSARAFNQPIGSWNVSNVTNMSYMFGGSPHSFNQNIGSWNVSNVTNMVGMFTIGAGVSTTNYDALLIGWATITPPETPLKPNVTFSAGSSKYCNGATARASIISSYGWTMTDGGLVTNCVLATDEFETNSIKLYPNPVLNVLNVKVDSNLINQPYNIFDSLGRVIIKGNLNDIETSINVEQLSKGIYYLKVSDNNTSKFVKE